MVEFHCALIIRHRPTMLHMIYTKVDPKYSAANPRTYWVHSYFDSRLLESWQKVCKPIFSSNNIRDKLSISENSITILDSYKEFKITRTKTITITIKEGWVDYIEDNNKWYLISSSRNPQYWPVFLTQKEKTSYVLRFSE